MPQGDPFSMPMMALISRPWLVEMRALGVIPRVLADDLFMKVVGRKAMDIFINAFDMTHKHLLAMGARISPKKCYLFVSHKRDRKWLRQHKWGYLQDKVPVANNCRDLGAHLNALATTMCGTTGTRRMEEVVESTKRMSMIRAPFHTKAGIIRTKMLPTAFYGCETAPVNAEILKKLQVVFVDAVIGSSSRRSPNLEFSTCSYGSDVDPDIVITQRRVAALRRYLVKTDDEGREKVHQIIKIYPRKQEPGAYKDQATLLETPPAGAPTTPHRAKMRKKGATNGPRGPLIQTLFMQASAMNLDYAIFTTTFVALRKSPRCFCMVCLRILATALHYPQTVAQS